MVIPVARGGPRRAPMRDPSVKVKEVIDKLVAELTTQQADEASLRN